MRKLIFILILIVASKSLSAQAIDSLYAAAKAYTVEENYYYYVACDLWNQIINSNQATEKQKVRARLILSQIYGNEGEIENMDREISALSSFVAHNPQETSIAEELEEIKMYRNEIIKQNSSFFDDICGTWVSDFSCDETKVPYLIMEVNKLSDGEYSVTLSPDCTLYEALKSPTAAVGYNPKVFYDKASFFFGDKRFKRGNPYVAQMGVNIVGDVGKELHKSFTYQGLNSRDFNSRFKNELGKKGVEIGVTLFSALFKELAISKTYSVAIDMLIERKFAGCASIVIHQDNYVERSDGEWKHNWSDLPFMIYKLYPEYNIEFLPRNSGKNVKELNTMAYAKLKNYVLQSYSSIAYGEDAAMLLDRIEKNFKYSPEGALYTEVDTKNGDHYYGYLHRWKNTPEGFGFLKYNNSITADYYIGEFKDGYRHGKGHLKFMNSQYESDYKGNFEMGLPHGVGEMVYRTTGHTYIGEFKNGQRHGQGKEKTPGQAAGTFNLFEGVYINGEQGKGIHSFATGAVYEGVFNGKTANGGRKYFTGTAREPNGECYEGRFDMETGNFEGKYTNSSKEILEGKITVNPEGLPIGDGKTTYVNGDKYEGKQYERNGRWIKHGKGKLIRLNGSIVEGIWENDKLIGH